MALGVVPLDSREGVIFFSDLGKRSNLIWCFDCKGTIVNCLDSCILF